MPTEKQLKRIEVAEERAARLRAEANQQFEEARAILAPIPPGQPILFGHHSARGHVRRLERHDRKIAAACATSRQADRASASTALAGYAITADDPEAPEALRAKIAKLEKQRDTWKDINRAFRSGGIAALAAVVGEEETQRIARDMDRLALTTVPYPQWKFTNLGANLRRYKARLAELEREAERPEAEPVQGDGWTIEEDSADCRIRVVFDSKPSREVCQLMRSYGFKWAPSVGAWQRLLNAAGRLAASRVAECLAKNKEG